MSTTYFLLKPLLGYVWIPFITDNWKYYSKIIFKCVNSAVWPSFNENFAEKSICKSREQCTGPTDFDVNRALSKLTLR